MRFKWRHRSSSFGEEFAWTYKRNYRAYLSDMDGDMYSAHITETTTGKTILYVYSRDEIIGKKRAEEILKALAKGHSFEPNDTEKSADEYEFFPENINYMEKTPYELQMEQK